MAAGDSRMRILLIASTIVLGLATICVSGSTSAAEPHGRESLNEFLKPYLERYGLPAVAAAVARNGRIVAAGAVGTRRAGTNIPVTIDDRFHIGSDTKAMTALLAAMFVERGALGWDSTVAQVFPELAG